METILGLILLLLLLVGGGCLFFLVFIQPIWGVVDVAVSKEHSGGTKAAVILLTLLLLGPIMTFFYACFGTRSRVLRRSTLLSFVVLLLFGGAALGLAIAVPMLKQKLPWQSAPAQSAEGAENTTTAPVPVPAEVTQNNVDPETVPAFTAVHLVPMDPQGGRPPLRSSMVTGPRHSQRCRWSCTIFIRSRISRWTRKARSITASPLTRWAESFRIPGASRN